MRVQTNWAAMIAAQCRVVPMIYGTPGSAKTAVFRALAESANRRFLQCILRQMMPEDLGGVPVPRTVTIAGADHECVVKLLDETIIRARTEPSVVLLDEFNHAGHDVMGAAQEWINDPPAHCWMAACSNPVEQSTSGVELSPPVVNRMCVLTWERPVNERREGWRNGFRNYPAPNVPIVPNDYLDVFGAIWGELMCEFEDRFPDLFGDDAFPNDPNKACEPWPSDRSWTNVGILMAACDAVGANSMVRKQLIHGCVGEGAGNQFIAWLQTKSLPDPEAILADPSSLRLPQRFDQARAIVCSVLGRLQADCTPDRWEAGYDVAETAFVQQQETAVMYEGRLWKLKPEGHLPRERNGVSEELKRLRLSLTK